MLLTTNYSGPAITYFQGQPIDSDTPIRGSFQVIFEDEYFVLLDPGEDNGYTYKVPRLTFDGRATVYH